MSAKLATEERLAKKSQQFDFPVDNKIAVVGHAGVGKSRLIQAWEAGPEGLMALHENDEKEKSDDDYLKSNAKDKPCLSATKRIRVSEVNTQVTITEVHTDWEMSEYGEQMESMTKNKELISEYQSFLFMIRQTDSDSVHLVDQYASALVEHAKSDKSKPISALLLVIEDSEVKTTGMRNIDSLIRRFEGALFRRHGIKADSLVVPSLDLVESKVFEAVETTVDLWRDAWADKEEVRQEKAFKEEMNKSAFLDVCMSGGATVMYDMLTIVVSLADVSTDLWVLIQWYQLKRTVPFYISLTILGLAQISYIGAFVIRFCDNGNWTMRFKPKYSYQTTMWKILPILFCISPLLSFVMYFASIPNTFFWQWMKDRGFEIEDYKPSRNATKIEIFLESKLMKHMGFLLEAAVEAFPQSILQMAVMVYYSETNWISVASILLSLISVCTKSLVFSYALELRTMIFNYLSIVLDFISVFALITWVFYNPDGRGLTQLAQIWVLKISITTVPAVYFIGFCYATALIFDDWKWRFKYHDHPWRETFGLFFLCYFAWMVGSPFGVLMVEMCCCSGLAFLLFMTFANRFSGSEAQGIFWGQAFSFINAGWTWKDKKLRTILVLESMLQNKGTKDSKLFAKIKENRQDLYEHVTWKDLRTNITHGYRSTPLSLALNGHDEMWDTLRRHSDMGHWSDIKRKWKDTEYNGPISVIMNMLEIPMVMFVGYFCMPVYFFSRIFNFTFVWIALSMTKFEDIDNLQLGMAGLLGFLQILWFCALISVLRLHFVTWHIHPGRSVSIGSCSNEDAAFAHLKKITDLHQAYTIEPLRKQAVIDHFGPDIGSVLLLYVPTLVYDLGNRGEMAE